MANEPSDLRRGLEATGPSVSDQAALRLERARRSPSMDFRLGAALGAWRNAAATLAYDLKTPSGDGDDGEAIAQDCYDEGEAFAHLEAARRSLGLTAPQIVGEARLGATGVLPAWLSRQSGTPAACR